RRASVSRAPRLSWLPQPPLNLLFSQAHDHEAAAPCPANPTDRPSDHLTAGHRSKCGCRTSKGTIRRVLCGIDASLLDRITGGWLAGHAAKVDDDELAVAVDGKVLRGAWTDENDQV